jgi:hypothetical protein
MSKQMRLRESRSKQAAGRQASKQASKHVDALTFSSPALPDLAHCVLPSSAEASAADMASSATGNFHMVV